MSEPAAFAIIRDGQKRFYGDRWVGALLHRDIIWGPEAFETWLLTLNELDEWYDDIDGGAVVDFDQRRLIWCIPGELLSVPKVAAVYGQLLAKIRNRSGDQELRIDRGPRHASGFSRGPRAIQT
ncbi:MAG: hypothetical protein SFV81_07330 [Pirellulaceae bacterium]|nr:hypothetical protein [Pirellulaceae bacterium]